MSLGILYVVSTPIGNLEDITFRAIRVLKEVDIIAAEDTRHSLKLLNHYGISKPLISYWSETEKVRSVDILNKLRSGLSIALISDAGTPGISDPGALLIKKAIEEGIEIISVPGPSAFVAALSISGLSTDEFTFFGFLPQKQTHRQKRLKDIAFEQRTLIFYEAPHRLLDTLKDMLDILGNRKAVVVKEITKIHEETVRGYLEDIIEIIRDKKIAGEYVIIMEGAKGKTLNIEEALSEVRLLIKKGKGRKEAVKIVADEYGISKKELYEKSLKG
jgi:16S rRNA (cytidine1402-2'-O)-methyltransferase